MTSGNFVPALALLGASLACLLATGGAMPSPFDSPMPVLRSMSEARLGTPHLFPARSQSQASFDELLKLLDEKRDEILEAQRLQEQAKLMMTKPRVAMFMHSLERNGANNFCLHLVAKLMAKQPFSIIFAPKEGPMREDLEKLGLRVEILDPAGADFLPVLEKRLKQEEISVVFANTIMRCDVVNLATRMGLRTVWVIHEAWPQDQLDYYAKEVFMMKNLEAAHIKEAFRNCGCIVFPSDVQKSIYEGMFRPDAAITVYNGIPLQQLDAFRAQNDRDEVRKSLGYNKDDFVVLHLGTICNRKGQINTAKCVANLVKDMGCSDLKCLMVGARYIRDHEIKYIEEIKEAVTSSGLDYVRWEDTPEEDHGKARVTVMDIQSDVLKFYMAADVVVVPSLNEVLPLVICEAMAFERPVVCSAIDAIPEALKDGVEGFLVPPGDPDSLGEAILKIYKDPSLSAKLGKAGRERVLRQFSYDVMVGHYNEIIDDLNSKPPVKPVSEENFSAKKSLTLARPSSENIDSSCWIELRKNLELAETQRDDLIKQLHDLRREVSELKRSPGGGSPLRGMTVLIDMDNTVVDWDAMFIKRYCVETRATVDEGEALREMVRKRQHFEIEANFPADLQDSILHVIAQPGFYASLETLPGAVEALREMVARGIDVKLVTAPHPVCPGSCASEKYDFLLTTFGSDWIDRMIITRDKTHVMGAVLIDDKPNVSGSNRNPTWTHVLFDQAYNKGVTGKPRLANWADWEKTLKGAMGITE